MLKGIFVLSAGLALTLCVLAFEFSGFNWIAAEEVFSSQQQYSSLSLFLAGLLALVIARKKVKQN